MLQYLPQLSEGDVLLECCVVRLKLPVIFTVNTVQDISGQFDCMLWLCVFYITDDIPVVRRIPYILSKKESTRLINDC